MRTRVILLACLLQIIFIQTTSASDFEWLDKLNVSAVADSSGFRLRLATRFHIGDAEVKAVIGNTDRPADAYMILRLAELSHRPIADVTRVYRSQGRKGWGVIAKNLGIKPGSREFHALKQGHDLEHRAEHTTDHRHEKPAPPQHSKSHGPDNKGHKK